MECQAPYVQIPMELNFTSILFINLGVHKVRIVIISTIKNNNKNMIIYPFLLIYLPNYHFS